MLGVITSERFGQRTGRIPSAAPRKPPGRSRRYGDGTFDLIVNDGIMVGKQWNKVEWIEVSDGIFNCNVDGILLRCVSCDKPIEHVIWKRDDEYEYFSANNHCSDKHEASKQAANTRLREPLERDRQYGQRLAEGFDMLDEYN